MKTMDTKYSALKTVSQHEIESLFSFTSWDSEFCASGTMTKSRDVCEFFPRALSEQGLGNRLLILQTLPASCICCNTEESSYRRTQDSSKRGPVPSLGSAPLGSILPPNTHALTCLHPDLRALFWNTPDSCYKVQLN